MEFNSVSQYLGQSVKITLSNTFWYRAKITSVEEHAVVFIEEKGKIITVEPCSIMMIEPLGGRT